MSVCIINPNSTQAMTEAMVAAARAAAPELGFEGWTSHDGPASIQGPKDGEAATGPLLALVEKAAIEGAEGIVIGCFDDTALNRAAALAHCPVIGIGQASYHHAALRNWRFSVVTTLSVSVPVLEHNIHALGFGHLLGRVRASEVPVLELESNPGLAGKTILDEARQAARSDGIDALVLGCAGMVHVTRASRRALNLPVIDPVEAGARCMSWLCRKTSHHGD